MPWASIVVYAGLRIEALAAYGRPGTGKRCRASQFWRGRRLGATPAPSSERPAGTLRFAGAPRPGLLPPTTQKAQINPGLSPQLDEKRGSRQMHHGQPFPTSIMCRFMMGERLNVTLQFDCAPPLCCEVVGGPRLISFQKGPVMLSLPRSATE